MSAGNDVVSVKAINITRSNQYKFYSKILSPSENPLYNEFGLAGISFENFVWLLWSIKESAYKFLQRDQPSLIFTPIKFVVKELRLPVDYAVENFTGVFIEAKGFEKCPCIKGQITIGPHTLYTSSLLYNEVISTVVNNLQSFQKVHWGIKLISNSEPESQSNEVRLFLLNKLKQLYKNVNFKVAKNEQGCPILLKDSIDSGVPISLSHHEHFVAYSFQI
ncbi:holo-ACP synthase [Mucilaginibacter xinganensis]|uniref:Uncharacterized protein n=1 Tax=Mucilaginibacter xinganensis TaxID=1234841 RepID=A0A223NXH6_9SPHI|nr:4'-phosphopantetheinyl transferase superfamily protein [Mucilaginibacter xinganensis]ASU34577.1 hypothetical protein MuYL_2690 [Mucilaginibacter xinganensis]